MTVFVSVQLLKEFSDLISRQGAARLTEQITQFRGGDVAIAIDIWGGGVEERESSTLLRETVSSSFL